MNKQPRINNDNTANHQHQHHNTVNHKHQHHNTVNHQHQHHKVNHQYQQQQQQQNQYQLSSYPHQQPIKQLHQLPVQQSQQSDEDQDILQKIDSLLLQNQSQSNHLQNQQNKYAQRQMLLNFKITQLQKIINNLNSTNKKLKTQLDNYHHQEQSNKFINQNNNNNQQVTNSNNNILNCSSSSQSPYNDQLTQMQGQFQQIQHLISQYKQQLAVSEKKWITIKEQKDQQIQSLKKQLIDLSQSKDIVQGEMQKILEENQMLKNKNQQLLIEIQNLQIQLENNKRQQQQYLQQQYIPSHIIQQQYPQQHFPQQQLSPRYTQRKHDQLFQDYRFNQKIQRQMQTMIKKLLKQLSNQKKINSKMTMEIKRLNGEVIQLQRKIKLKNDAIYQLQMKIINIEKHYNNLTARNNISNVDRNYVNNVMNTNRINSNHSKNTPLTLTPSQNKNQSSKIKFHNNTINKYQPVNNRINNNIQQQIKFKHKQQITMNQYYQPNQYTDQSDNNYDDYVLTSLPFKGSHSSPKNQPQIQQNLISNNSMNVQTSSSKFPQSHNFIKPKKIQNKSKNTNISAYQQRSQNDKSLNKQFMAFTLMQLEQGKMKITMKQKIIIISKLIEVYCKKIKSQNYQNLSAQQIQVYNFNDKHPNLVRIRVINGGSKTDISTGVHEQNEESLMYNLAFIVESLVKDVQTIDRQDLQVDLNLSDIIEEILGKNMEQKIAYFQQLSRSLENSVVNLM